MRGINIIDFTEAEKKLNIGIDISYYIDDFGNVMMKIGDGEPELVMSRASLERGGEQ
jgi:hypothetical protein